MGELRKEFLTLCRRLLGALIERVDTQVNDSLLFRCCPSASETFAYVCSNPVR